MLVEVVSGLGKGETPELHGSTQHTSLPVPSPPCADIMMMLCDGGACMERQYWKTGSWLVAALLWFSCVSAAVAAIPPCGSDPKANTLLLQNAIDQAPAGSTLELRRESASWQLALTLRHCATTAPCISASSS